MRPWPTGPRSDQGFQPGRTGDMFPLPIARTYEAGLPPEVRIRTGASRYTGRPEGPEYGPRPRTGPIGRDIKDPGACLLHHTTG